MEVIHDFCSESQRNDWPVVKIYNATNREQSVSSVYAGGRGAKSQARQSCHLVHQ